MNTILLQPTDVLFFRDGRPMSGSLAGHGAAWPLPKGIKAALPSPVMTFCNGQAALMTLGIGQAAPWPNVINAAFHAALHRAQLDADGSQKLHTHGRGARGAYAEDARRDRKFGSLL